MANIIPKKVSKIFSDVRDYTSSDTVTTILTSEANKLWRAKILLDRVTKPGEKDNPDEVFPNTNATPSLKKGSEKQQYKPVVSSKSTLLNKNFKSRLQISFHPNKEDIIPANLTGESRRQQLNKSKPTISIYNFFTYPIQSIELQTIPKDLEISSEGTWAVINSSGRNLPMYHYTGSETTIQFNISWYANDPKNPQDVLAKCRLLERWSKADGYEKAPPLLQIDWGTGGIFGNFNAETGENMKGPKYYFILQSASYKLSGWQTDARILDPHSNQLIPKPGYTKRGLKPCLATQELIFKRVSARSITYSDIISDDSLRGVQGIKGF
jgi:hypothetical protein|nr:MAG TPA: Pvc1, Pvc9, Pvc11, Pvc12, Pvc4, Photorhabdus asymbiotica, PVC, contractile.5A [Caudoviricetes sp.]